MEMSFGIDTKKLARFIKQRNSVFLASIRKNFARAGWYFIGRVTLQQLSGRVSARRGLNVITGTLRRSFRSRVITSNTSGDAVVKIYSMAKYADIHQYGGATGRNHSVIIPKRLYVIEDFRNEGVKMFAGAIRDSIRETVS